MLVIAATSGARKLPPSPKKLQVRTISQHAIKVKWHDPGRLKDDGSRFYSVRYSAAGQEEKPKFVQTQEKRVRVSKLQPNTTYVFASRPWWASRAAPGAPPPLPPQGSRVSSKVVKSESSEKPALDCYLLVSWRPPPVRRRHGVLLGYKVQYKRKGSRRGDLCTVITKPRDTQYILTDVAEGEIYKVRVGATTVNGTGPFSAWEKVAIPVANKSDGEQAAKEEQQHERDGGDARPAGEPGTLEVRSTAITLTWTQPQPPACCPVVAYRILTRNLNTSELSGEVVTGPTPEAKISFLLPDTIYGFIVSSYSVGGESEPSEELLVQTLPAEPPMILQLLATVVVEGSTANLTCVVRAEPPPEVQWFAPNKTVPFSSQASTNLILHNETGVRVISVHKSSRDVTSHLLIQGVTFRQAGVYFCVAKNSAGTVRSPVRLQVNVVPAIVDIAGMEVMEGRPARLMCSVSGSPLPTVVWTHQDTGSVFEPSDKNIPENSSLPIVTSLTEDRMRLVSSWISPPRL
ncbi:netrin receptor DCC-like [Pomacea canaliculata]|uniref:netrin receptor DCC-like n=1 Tax=Pomacea canaliculata TaxID=400727 RepID=UPI000D72CD79|nr:netrin receptor DCC-like [Pomacea canaliculata]